MDVRIQSIHFDASEQLQAFISFPQNFSGILFATLFFLVFNQLLFERFHI